MADISFSNYLKESVVGSTDTSKFKFLIDATLKHTDKRWASYISDKSKIVELKGSGTYQLIQDLDNVKKIGGVPEIAILVTDKNVTLIKFYPSETKGGVGAFTKVVVAPLKPVKMDWTEKPKLSKTELERYIRYAKPVYQKELLTKILNNPYYNHKKYYAIVICRDEDVYNEKAGTLDDDVIRPNKTEYTLKDFSFDDVYDILKTGSTEFSIDGTSYKRINNLDFVGSGYKFVVTKDEIVRIFLLMDSNLKSHLLSYDIKTRKFGLSIQKGLL